MQFVAPPLGVGGVPAVSYAPTGAGMPFGGADPAAAAAAAAAAFAAGWPMPGAMWALPPGAPAGQWAAPGPPGPPPDSPPAPPPPDGPGPPPGAPPGAPPPPGMWGPGPPPSGVGWEKGEKRPKGQKGENGEKGGKGGKGPPPNRVVYLDLGERQPTSEELQEAFVPFGLVEKITARARPDGRYSCFVTYTSPRAAARLVRMGHIQIGGEKRKCNFSHSGFNEGPSKYDRPGKHIWVGFRHRHDITQDDVGMTFAQFGDVQTVELHHENTGNHYATVEFCTEEAAISAMNAPPRVKDTEAFCEWFHPGEPLGPAHAAQAPPAPLPPPTASPPPSIAPAPAQGPPVARTVTLRFPMANALMGDGVRDLLQRFGPIEEVALSLEGDRKVAHAVFAQTDGLKACMDAVEAAKGAPVLNDLPECAFELPPAAAAALGGPVPVAPPPAAAAGRSGLAALPPHAAAAAVSSAVPSQALGLIFESAADAQAVGPDALRELFLGSDSAQVLGRFAFVHFPDAVLATGAKEKAAKGEISIPSAPLVVFARKGAAQSVASAAVQPAAGAPAEQAPQQLAPPVPQSDPNGVIGARLQQVPGSTALVPAGGGTLMLQPLGPWAAVLQGPKSTTPPACPDLKAAVDAVAERAAQGEVEQDAMLVLQTDNAPYFRYKVDALRQGLSSESVDALARMKAAAARMSAGEKPAHLQLYTEEGEIPFEKGAPVLLLGEGDFSFARALAERLGGGTGICATSLLTKEETQAKYPQAAENTAALVAMGGYLVYGFDAEREEGYSTLKEHGQQFASVVFNFPCAVDDDGENSVDAEDNAKLFRRMFKHLPLVMQSRARIYVTLLSGPQLQLWQPSRMCLRAESGLRLINRFPFRKGEYRGYTPEIPQTDSCARFRTPWTLVFGKKKKYEPFDEIEERDHELEKIKRKKKKKRASTSSSSSSRPRKARRKRSRSRSRARKRRR
eukprot:TRINITY_DN7231_c0_g2_i2.p1 TRINITY_DN7231_c0_g2~~TRINITY_DN7231_c0_g2_i2.p1  ORF type:complete len:990 (+),score=258.56 TRINITY_DN7231_c0_g2_i2:89-2971(+)